ncbi:ABC transporter substrate-binding protein [Tomitella fengzijianii]|uniref:ABC transporter substrate-binding protein n=1 Tax=Tomitella fengzijianii TaxID=2597660 RepID=A0A516X1C7_9ACTN|nr:ABC transporter substrate-binding protein [Tomitella fengzijianii]QDQ96886.1 ABC transporter substrate-binding protein [Tomitella fengzijianii]
MESTDHRAGGRRRRRVRTAGRAGLAVLAAAVLVTGCASSDGGGSGDGTGNAAPSGESGAFTQGLVNVQSQEGDVVRGGTLTFGVQALAPVLDPGKQGASRGGTGGDAAAAVYDVLMKYDPDSGEFTPQLAESLTSDDDVTWTLKLRDGVKFSDGTPMDAQAVAASFDRYTEQNGADAGLWKQTVESATATDPLTVTITLTAPWHRFPSMLALGYGMIVAPTAGSGDAFKPIGAGPFTEQEFRPGEARVLKANPDYWGGPPPLDTVRMVALNGPQENVDSLKSGGLDLAYIRGLAPAIKDVVDAGFPGYVGILNSGSAEIINNREGRAGADVRVRKAIAMALNPEQIGQRAEKGEGIPTSDIFAKSSRWHPDVPGVAFDPDQAKKLLDEAKADGYDGTLDYVFLNEPKDHAIALAVQALLQKVGFTVNMHGATSAADIITGVYVQHDFDIAHAGLGFYESIPDLGLQGVLQSDSPSNTAGYADPQMDALIAKFRSTASEDDARAVMGEIQKHWNATVPSAPIGALPSLWAWQKNVHGVEPSATGIMLLGEAWKSGS